MTPQQENAPLLVTEDSNAELVVPRIYGLPAVRQATPGRRGAAGEAAARRRFSPARIRGAPVAAAGTDAGVLRTRIDHAQRSAPKAVANVATGVVFTCMKNVPRLRVPQDIGSYRGRRAEKVWVKRVIVLPVAEGGRNGGLMAVGWRRENVTPSPVATPMPGAGGARVRRRAEEEPKAEPMPAVQLKHRLATFRPVRPRPRHRLRLR